MQYLYISNACKVSHRVLTTINQTSCNICIYQTLNTKELYMLYYHLVKYYMYINDQVSHTWQKNHKWLKFHKWYNLLTRNLQYSHGISINISFTFKPCYKSIYYTTSNLKSNIFKNFCYHAASDIHIIPILNSKMIKKKEKETHNSLLRIYVNIIYSRL